MRMQNRRRLSAALGVLLGLALPAGPANSPAWAAGPAGEAAHAAAGGHGEADKPALLQYDPGASVWTILTFVLLLVLLRLTAWKPILRVLNDREAFIRKSIEDAKHERAEAEKLLAEYQARLDRARLEASQIVDEGKRDAEVAARRVQDEARREAEQMLERARREVQLAADAAIRALYDQAAALAVDVAGRIIRKDLSAADHRALVDEALQQMQARKPAGLN